MNMNFATWGRLMMSVLPPCSSTITAMSPPLASTDLPSPPPTQQPDLTSPPSAEKTSTSTPPPPGWVQNPVSRKLICEYYFRFWHVALSTFKNMQVLYCMLYEYRSSQFVWLAWIHSAFRDSAVVQLNFSEERPPKPPRLYLTRNENLASVVNSHSFIHCN